jgi:Putative Flp pilus-assembly TadE/G-like
MKRLRDEEQGAVLAIVAISLLALLGMVVLTFDLGRGVALKRNMVNAADAGALAAARECGLANGTGPAETAAKDLIAENNSSATLVGAPQFDSASQCEGQGGAGERQVRVTVSVPQEYFFAQIFGFNDGTVTASATAEWTLGLTSPAPLRIDQLKIDECEEAIPDPLTGRRDCYFTFEKGGQPLNSDWGWLNLPEGWPIKGQDDNPMTCSAQAGGANDLNDYIGTMGGMGTPDKEFSSLLWDPTGGGTPATYVCGSTGHKSTSVKAIQAWVDNVKTEMAKDPNFLEPVVNFPVVACDTAKMTDSSCREWKYTPGAAYPVVKLQGFYVKEALDGQDARRNPNCEFTRKSSDVFCVHLQTLGPDDPPASGGSVQVWLVD